MRSAANRPSLAGLVPLLAILPAFAGCARDDRYPSRPITLICPWAAGGGTDRVSRQVAAHLEQDLGVPVNVVNAVGGKGVTGHSRGLSARPDGYTLTMATLELNMLHWSRLTDLSHKDCALLVSVNEDPAALFVRVDAPWQTLPELERDVAAQPGRLKSSGTAAGAAWHLALAGWLEAAGFEVDDVTWVSSTGANPSLQELISGGVDMVCCSLPEAATLLKAGQVRALGVMARQRAAEHPDVPTFAEQGRDWVLTGWRGLAVPPDTSADVKAVLVAALERVVTGQTSLRIGGTAGHGAHEQTFPEFMQQEGFDHTWRGPEEFRSFLDETDARFGALLTSPALQSVNRDRYDRMTFPNLVLVLLGITAVALALQHLRARLPIPSSPHRLTPSAADPAASEAPGGTTLQRAPLSNAGLINFLTVVAAAVAFALFAETVGYVLLAGMLVLVLLLRLGTRPVVSAAVALLFAPAVYHVFSVLLRVPLPRGWWGW